MTERKTLGHLGFIHGGLNYFTCGPKAYCVGAPALDHSGIAQYLKDIGQEANDDQLRGEPGDVLIELGGRDCYLSYGKGRNSHDNVANMIDQDHGSVFRHGMITFKFAFISRFCTHEVVRHAAGTAISQISTRYVDIGSRLGFVVPAPDVGNPVDEAEFNAHCQSSMRKYRWKFERERAKGLDLKEARGIARNYLSDSVAQVMQMSFTCQAARHFLHMRSTPWADQEIRNLANAMVPHLKRVWPVACEDLELITSDNVKYVSPIDRVC